MKVKLFGTYGIKDIYISISFSYFYFLDQKISSEKFSNINVLAYNQIN